ncbi:LOW QUALITY PROTEIN: hypothetical protein KUTeg_015878 [Tegillarca granosa]|uniref:Uncharacterized protein n=1 Tax=Tegillarca granosa TaxID=220873 RepID=A0ABQ9EJ79_TEGGR|nr:LOW QUALITY PROTEIN: hypothetical protein KUTeg_015878 [Tegillarca granosa]
MRTVVFGDMTDSLFSGSELESMQGNMDMSMSDSNKKKTGRKSRPYKYQVFDEKLANILLNKNVNTANGVDSCSTTKGAYSADLSQRHTDSDEDELSLNPGQEKVRGVSPDSENETTIIVFQRGSLTDIFGDDALAKKSDKDVGIEREVLKDTLIRRHGKKAGFIRNARHLYSQPYKMIEKTAYRWQQAAYLEIVINLYIQQGLASLMSILKEDVCDMD